MPWGLGWGEVVELKQTLVRPQKKSLWIGEKLAQTSTEAGLGSLVSSTVFDPLLCSSAPFCDSSLGHFQAPSRHAGSTCDFRPQAVEYPRTVP